MELDKALTKLRQIENPLEPNGLYAMLYVRTFANRGPCCRDYICMTADGMWNNLFRSYPSTDRQIHDFEKPDISKDVLRSDLLGSKKWRIMSMECLCAFNNQYPTASALRRAWNET
jgi:hypothetical protein